MYSVDEIAVAKKSLPKAVVDFADSRELQETLASIGKEIRLTLHEIDALTQLVNATILGLVSRDAFPGLLGTELARLNAEEHTKILNTVNERVFKVLNAKLHQPAKKSVDD